MTAPLAPTLIQDLVLTLDAASVEMQLTNCAVAPTYADTEISTFGGNFVDTKETFALHLEGFQDYGALESLCDLLWAADITDTITFLLTIETATWSGVVSPRKPSAGGAAGAALDFTIDLPVQGDVTYTPPTVFASDGQLVGVDDDRPSDRPPVQLDSADDDA